MRFVFFLIQSHVRYFFFLPSLNLVATSKHLVVGKDVVGDEVVGAEVVGTDVVGTEVIGVEVVGAEVVGVEVVGAEVVGEEVMGASALGILDDIIDGELLGSVPDLLQ